MKHLDWTCLMMVIIISLSCGYVVAKASSRQKREILIEKEQQSKKSSELNLAKAHLKKLNQTLDETEKTLKSLNEKIPVSGSIGTFLKQLDVMMKEREIALLSVQPQPGQMEKLFSRIPIRLVFQGSFDRVYQTIHSLESLKRIVRFEKMSITDRTKMQICQVDLTLSTFEQGSENHNGRK